MLSIHSNAADSGHGLERSGVNMPSACEKKHVTCHKFRLICIETSWEMNGEKELGLR
jgi:hypothetical protein